MRKGKKHKLTETLRTQKVVELMPWMRRLMPKEEEPRLTEKEFTQKVRPQR
jgi:hypothetical protein